MTLVAIERGLYFPPFETPMGTSVGTLDLTGEKYAMMGHVYFNDRPTDAKAFNTGSILYRTATCVWAAAAGGTTMDVGIQGVATTGPMARPNGSYSVKRTLASPVGVTSAAWNTAVMNTGALSLTHGDLIAVVWDMTLRGGSDSVQVTAQIPPYVANLQAQFPTTNAFFGGNWQSSGVVGNAQRWPNVILVTDDGTLGTIAPTCPLNTVLTDQYSASINPDERGMVFQVPFNCTIDGLWAFMGIADAGQSDFNIKLYSNPTLSTPTQLVSVPHTAERMSGLGAESIVHKPIAPLNLAKNTDYLVSLEATGTSSIRQAGLTVADASHRVFYPGGATLRKGSRQNATGAFIMESPPVTLYRMGVMISHIDAADAPPTFALGM